MATRIKLDSHAESMDTQALRCRSENHLWVRISEAVTGVRRGTITQIEVVRLCGSCDTERVDTYDLPSFELKKRRYHYTTAFKPIKAKGEKSVRLPRTAYRAAYLTRELKEMFA